MQKLDKTLFSLLCAACASFFAISKNSALAAGENEFTLGIQYYKSKSFRLASKEFENSISHGNVKAPVFLYAAYAYQAYGDRDEALRKYHQIEILFKDSQASKMAKEARQRLDPTNSWMDRKPQLLDELKAKLQSQNQLTAKTSGTVSANVIKTASKNKNTRKNDIALEDSQEDDSPQLLAKISTSTPPVSRVFYTSEGDDIIVDVRINSRVIPMEFDTGAPGICIDKEMAKDLGLSVPQGKPDGSSGGSSNMNVIDFWNMYTTVQVGQIVKENTRVKIYEKIHTRPLLGQGFFKDFDYTIDHSAKCIEFRRKGTSRSGGNSQYTMPFIFKKEGRRIVIEVEINGKKAPVMLDTGNTANGISFYSKEQLKKFGINDLPDDAKLTSSAGVSGSGTCYSFNIPRVKLGPIEKTNVNASLANEVDDDEDLPLLGQDMLSGWQFTIDMERKVIHFLRR